MQRNERTASKVTLTLIDLGDMWGYYGTAVAKDGTRYILCTEGVGWPVTEAKPFDDENGRDWTLSEIEAKAAESQRSQRLSEFIRVFGDRLESNYSLWSHKLSK